MRLRHFTLPVGRISLGFCLVAMLARCGAQTTGIPAERAQARPEISQPEKTLWQGTAQMSGGIPVDYYLELSRETSRISGRVHMTWGWVAIRSSQVNGNAFVLQLADAIPMHVDGQFVGNSLDLTIFDPRSAPLHFVSHRVQRFPAPPEPLPLPPLEDLSAHRVNFSSPPMGWNSWNHFAERIDEAAVRGIADALVSSGMRDAGYIYVLIDDGWAGLRDPSGHLRGNQKFPDIPALSAYIHARGLKLGLYSSPGPRTCDAYQGSFGHEDDDAKVLAAWGVDYLKYDWCSAGETYNEQQLRAVYQKMGAALQRSGRSIAFAICEYGWAGVESWGAEAGGSLWRISNDIQDNWQSMRKNALAAELLARGGKTGQWNDPDLLEVGNGGMTEAEYRTHMTLWAMLGAPLIAGNDPRHMDQTTRATLLNREVIALDQEPNDQPGKIFKTGGGLEMWRRPLHDGAEAIAVVNISNETQTVHLRAQDLGRESLPPESRDLWQHQIEQETTGGILLTLQAHDTALLRF